MKKCPYCNFTNYDQATECRKCQASFVAATFDSGTTYRSYHVGPIKAHDIRRKALSFLVLGLLIKVYWGGYGPWPIVDNPTLEVLRVWLEPLLVYGGAAGYVMGWILNWV